MPTWVDATGRRVEVTRRATDVVGHVREMQREALERIRKHQQRGAVGAQWVQERVHDRRPWMRQVLRSWASVCVGGARLGPNERVLSDDEWRAMRASETKATRVRRRQHEAIKRLINFGKIVVAKDKQRTQLRTKLQVAVRHVQRQIRARSRWRSAGGRESCTLCTRRCRDGTPRRAGRGHG